MTIVAHELKASYAFIERNFFLTRRYWGWELAFLVYSVAGALSISLIGADQGSPTLLLTLMVGAIFWNYLSVVFSWIAETISVERWEGTLEYTFMAPIRRWSQLLGSVLYAMVYGLVHTAVIFIALVLFFPQLDFSNANPVTAADVHAARLVQLRRHRDDRRHPAPAVCRARRTDDVRAAVVPAARQRRVLLGRDPARLDAGAVAPVAGDVRPRRRARRARRRARRCPSWATTSGRCSWPEPRSSRSGCGRSAGRSATPSAPAS